MRLKFWTKQGKTPEQRSIESLEKEVSKLQREVCYLQEAAHIRRYAPATGRQAQSFTSAEVIEQLLTHFSFDLTRSQAIPAKTVLAVRPFTNPEG